MAPEPKLPVIDFTSEDLKPGTPTWESVKNEVRAALEEFGCFIALFDKVPAETRKAVFESMEELFDQPLENRIKFSSDEPFHGYLKPAPATESMGVLEPHSPEMVKSFAEKMWPQGNSKFCKSVQTYTELLSELDNTVRRLILESLGLEKYMDEHLNSTHVLMRMMKYKLPENKTKLSLEAHTDKDTLTILQENGTNGLEIRTKDGQWIGISYPPNSYVVMIGDIFHAWTNGRLHAPFHRVVLKGSDTRYSVGLFSLPNPGYVVKVPEELVDEQHPLRYKTFEGYKFLKFYNAEMGKYFESGLQVFCGV